ncbi:MAG TPA: monovalent cation/H(+) antiporter subunit G [Bacteroidales bacterium]|nr:monovalent cation/H(+) antiporter subunit G [Bacteroidales bacterium]
MAEIIVIALLLTGSLVILVAAIGLLRMPDVYLRMSSATIAATFGVASMLLALPIHFGSSTHALHVLGVIVFLILSVPVGSHMMGIAAYVAGLPMWKGTKTDQLKDQINLETGSVKPDGDNPAPAEEDENEEEDWL